MELLQASKTVRQKGPKYNKRPQKPSRSDTAL